MLKLYALGYTPNAEGQLHFIGTHAQLLTRLGTPALQVDGNDYRINGGQLFVTFSNNANYVDAITYAIDTDDTGKWRCYHVNAGRIESGFVVFDVSVDWWGTAYNDANVVSMAMRRCNRKYPKTGIYDILPEPLGAPTITPLSDDFAQSMALIYAVTLDVGKSTLSGAASVTRVYRTLVGQNDLKDLLIKVGNIYGVADTSTAFKSYKARVFNAWLVPLIWFSQSTGEGAITFNTYDGSNDATIDGINLVESVNVSLVKENWQGLPGHLYRFGPRTMGMELLNGINPSNLYVVGEVGTDSVTIKVRQGNRELDITNALRVPLTLNDGNLTAQERIAKGIGALASTGAQGLQVGGGALRLMAGDVSGAVTMAAGAAGFGATITGLVSPTVHTSQTPSGDGLANINKNTAGQLITPLCIHDFASAGSADMIVRKNGARFNDIYTNTLASLQQYELMGSIPSGTEWGDATFLQADVVYRGQAAVADVVKRHLSQGIYYAIL